MATCPQGTSLETSTSTQAVEIDKKWQTEAKTVRPLKVHHQNESITPPTNPSEGSGSVTTSVRGSSQLASCEHIG